MRLLASNTDTITIGTSDGDSEAINARSVTFTQIDTHPVHLDCGGGWE